MLSRITAKIGIGVMLVTSAQAQLAAGGDLSLHPETATLLTIRSQVNEVQVSFLVEDSKKRLVHGVEPQAIRILDNGQPVSALTSFRENSDLPLRLLLLLDCSDSMRKGFARQRAAAQAFIERLLRPNRDTLLLVDFAGQSTISEMQTSPQPNLIAARMNSLTATGHTAVYDAIYEAARKMQSSTEPHPARRVMILLSDGEDNDSRRGRAEAIEKAQRAEIVIYAITAHSRRYEFQGDAILRQIAEATGGRAFVLNSFDQLDKVFADIETDLRAQYSVTFRPPVQDNCGSHVLQVLHRDRRMKVRAREGYSLCGTTADDSIQ